MSFRTRLNIDPNRRTSEWVYWVCASCLSELTDIIKAIIGGLFGWIIWSRPRTEKWGSERLPGGGNVVDVKTPWLLACFWWATARVKYAIRYDQKSHLVPFDEWLRASLANYIQFGQWGTRWEWMEVDGAWEKVELPRRVPKLRDFRKEPFPDMSRSRFAYSEKESFAEVNGREAVQRTLEFEGDSETID